MRVLIAHTTTDEHSPIVAKRIGQSIRSDHIETDVMSVSDAPGSLNRYNGVAIVAAVHTPELSENASAFVLSHTDHLNAHPSAFVSVSIDKHGKRLYSHGEAQKILAEFLSDTSWTPVSSITVEGPERSQSGRWFSRLVDKVLSADEATDGIDWNAIRYFAHAFGEKLKAAT